MAINDARIVITADDKTRAAVASAKAGLSSLQKSASSLASTFGLFSGALGVAAFTGLVKSSIDTLDKLNDLNKVTGISVEQLSGLSLAAEQSGTDLDGVANAISKLSVNIGKDAEKFRALGITAKDPLEAFKQLADVFVAIEDPQQRAAVAATALGKSWQSAAPLLAEGGARIGELVERGQKLSGATKEAADQADRFNDQLAELQRVGGRAGISIANNLLPSLNDTATAMKRLADEGNPLLALLRGFAGVGKLPFDLAISPTDFGVTGQIKNLREEIERLEAVQRGARGRLSLDGLLPSGEEGRKRIGVLKTQIENLEKFKDQIRAKKPVKDETKTPPSDVALKGFLGGEGKSAAEKAIRDRQKIFEENRRQEERNRGVDFDIEFSEIERLDEAFIKQRERVADLRKEFTDLVDPVQQYREQLDRVDEAERLGAISAEKANEARFKINDAIDAALGFNEVLKEQDSIARELGLTFSSAFEEAIVGGKDVRSVIQSLAQDLLKLSIRKTLTEPLFEAAQAALEFVRASSSGSSGGGGLGGILGLFGGLFGGGGGAASYAGSVSTTAQAFNAGLIGLADGGAFDGRAGLSAYSGSVVSSPTLFKFASGNGLMGEAGPEAILPLKRGSDGKLGVRLQQGGGSGGVVNNISIVINNDQSTQRGTSDQESTQLAKRLEAAVKQVLINEKRSGGLLAV